MKKYEILDKLSKNQISSKEAYKKLYQSKRRVKKARFVLIRISINDAVIKSLLLSILFFLPFPIVIFKIIIKIVSRSKKVDFGTDNVMDILNAISLKHIKVELKSHEGINVRIKTI